MDSVQKDFYFVETVIFQVEGNLQRSFQLKPDNIKPLLQNGATKSCFKISKSRKLTLQLLVQELFEQTEFNFCHLQFQMTRMEKGLRLEKHGLCFQSLDATTAKKSSKFQLMWQNSFDILFLVYNGRFCFLIEPQVMTSNQR